MIPRSLTEAPRHGWRSGRAQIVNWAPAIYLCI